MTKHRCIGRDAPSACALHDTRLGAHSAEPDSMLQTTGVVGSGGETRAQAGLGALEKARCQRIEALVCGSTYSGCASHIGRHRRTGRGVFRHATTRASPGPRRGWGRGSFKTRTRCRRHRHVACVPAKSRRWSTDSRVGPSRCCFLLPLGICPAIFAAGGAGCRGLLGDQEAARAGDGGAAWCEPWASRDAAQRRLMFRGCAAGAPLSGGRAQVLRGTTRPHSTRATASACGRHELEAQDARWAVQRGSKCRLPRRRRLHLRGSKSWHPTQRGSAPFRSGRGAHQHGAALPCKPASHGTIYGCFSASAPSRSP